MIRLRGAVTCVAAAIIATHLSAQTHETPEQPAYAEPGIAMDGSDIAFVSGGDIWTVPASGGEARLLISNAANDTRPMYSPDKTKLAFVSTRTGGGDVYVLTLASGEVRRITYDDGMDQLDGWSRDARSVYFFSNGHDLSGGMNDVYRVSADGGTPMAVSGDRYANEFYYLDDGRIQAVALDKREPRPINVTAELDVDFPKEKTVVFDQAWRLLNENFFDPAFNGVDWKAARAAVEPFIAGARTPDEMRRIASLMIGELNASHLGINPPPAGPNAAVVGHLGVDFDRAVYESSGRLRIAHIVALGPVALAGSVQRGDYILAIDGDAIGAHVNADALLENRINRRVVLRIANDASGTGAREIAVRPIASATERGLRYRQWVNERRDYVTKISNGRLGYVHMPDMSAASLAQLYVDLDADNIAREGVVIDVRNNSGGFVNVYALDVLSRRPFLNMTVRGTPTAPARSVLGQRALERPTVLVTNQHSLSDAEDFTEGYRAMGLGKVVGEPTAGWIIYTWNTRLLDGTILRLPRARITDRNGAPMEMHPRPVDIEVTRPIGESFGPRDSQLDKAVETLLAELKPTKSQ